MIVRRPAQGKTKTSAATVTCKCGLKTRDVDWILQPCGCLLETTCIRCTRTVATATLKPTADEKLRHHCGHTAPTTTWRVAREPHLPKAKVA